MATRVIFLILLLNLVAVGGGRAGEPSPQDQRIPPLVTGEEAERLMVPRKTWPHGSMSVEGTPSETIEMQPDALPPSPTCDVAELLKLTHWYVFHREPPLSAQEVPKLIRFHRLLETCEEIVGVELHKDDDP